MGMSRHHSYDEYLETIYFLSFPVGEYGPVVRDSPALAARIAEMLGVSAPSVAEMLKRLEADGMIERGRRRATVLTEKGRAKAEHHVRNHRIIERFLVDFMGYAPGDCHEQAEILGDTFTDDMVARLGEKLGNPERCPHGWPVDPATEQKENQELVALADIADGLTATIVRLAEHDLDLLKWFYDEGYVPGTEVTAVRVDGDQHVIVVDDVERAVPITATEGLFVRAPVAEPAAV